MSNAWVFARQGHTLSIKRCVTSGGAVLFVMGSDQDSRTYCFGDLSGLRTFQSRLEHFLVESGWSVQSLPLEEPGESDDSETDPLPELQAVGSLG